MAAAECEEAAPAARLLWMSDHPEADLPQRWSWQVRWASRMSHPPARHIRGDHRFSKRRESAQRLELVIKSEGLLSRLSRLIPPPSRPDLVPWSPVYGCRTDRGLEFSSLQM
ncbi:hypothetical protein AAFF_G00409550 [Aldrovandia affinis]|uniref:Uncharacterized protein n=1 Tax=Aldrovandia affinis TaxID=143900 RepID=A0AAD7SBL2_9TELE|nr:hypothetical protein AAFF_G00409550 [Aldrovandia affinis]